MAKLYFKYGVMGSSKSAQALITKFNYEERGMFVWLIKPSVDTRDGAEMIRSRIGLECRAEVISPDMSVIDRYHALGRRDVIIADEATAMLDPSGRKEVMNTVRSLNQNKGITVVWITHFMDEAALADRILVVSDGRVVDTGTPREIFSKVNRMREPTRIVPAI